MSCYEWERGSVKIPASEWSKFKKSILSTYNTIIKRDFAIALNTYNYLKVSAKGRRNFNYKQSLMFKLQEANLNYDSYNRIERAMFPWNKDRKTPLKPKKKDFKLVNNQTEQLSLDGFSIGLSNKNKTLYWEVLENNHAVDEAHNHPIAMAVFSALNNVTWKRNSGGIIVANDEYNRQDDSPFGGGNYVTHAFGPLGKNLQTFKFGLTTSYI
tara:strand:+ start:38 stop:673 length:636 start_codon:yes stop_codon:yes gene_type:complete